MKPITVGQLYYRRYRQGGEDFGWEIYRMISPTKIKMFATSEFRYFCTGVVGVEVCDDWVEISEEEATNLWNEVKALEL